MRLTQGHNAFRVRQAQRASALAVAGQAADLGEDVVGEAISRVVQARIPRRVLGFQRHVETEARTALDTDPLRRDRDVGIAFADHLAVRHEPKCGGIDAAGDVEPLDEQGSVERGRIARPQDDDAGGVIGAGRRRRAPPAVGTELADR